MSLLQVELDWRWGAMSSYIDINGIRLAWGEQGDGEETLILLNGVAMSMAHWQPFINSLKGKYRIILHDFRGQLLSDKPDDEYSLVGHAHDLAYLMDKLKIDKAHLVGTSYGSEVAMEMALYHPGKVQSLTLIDGVSELDPVLKSAVESWQLTALADPVLFYRTIIPWNYSPAFLEKNLDSLREREAKIASLPRAYFEGFNRLCEAFLKIDLTSRLTHISVPVLILVGEKDILKHRGFSNIINREIKGSILEVIENAGHAVVIENPAEVALRVETFLKKIR